MQCFMHLEEFFINTCENGMAISEILQSPTLDTAINYVASCMSYVTLKWKQQDSIRSVVTHFLAYQKAVEGLPSRGSLSFALTSYLSTSVFTGD